MKSTPNTATAQQKSELRKQLRRVRNSLTPAQQDRASQALFEILKALPSYQNSQHIAAYLANDGEISPQRLVQDAWDEGKQVYLPVVDPAGRGTLTFLPWQEDTVMEDNKYGIPEPDQSLYKALPAPQLDLVLLPLTGFDKSGKRMGMGGGYYDRTFAFMNSGEGGFCKLQLIGLAHEGQKVESIPCESWDIPLSGIATDQRFYAGQK